MKNYKKNIRFTGERNQGMPFLNGLFDVKKV